MSLIKHSKSYGSSPSSGSNSIKVESKTSISEVTMGTTTVPSSNNNVFSLFP